MPIELGLARISRLLSNIGNPHVKTFNSIHIAGTNGKGSTIAYISSILTLAQIRNGRFTSPHLLESNDCITINEETYPKKKFEEIRRLVSSQNENLALGCTEFELLTATAFKIFEVEKVELAIIEVGLGGRLDATNVLQSNKINANERNRKGVIIGGITKIAMDHENLLGDTIGAIAKEKAGIIKSNMFVVVDGTNDEAVLNTIRAKVKEENATLLIADTTEISNVKELIKLSPLRGEYQVQNLAVALSIVRYLRDAFHYDSITLDNITRGIQRTSWPGRLQIIVDKRTGISALIDGAHNENAAVELGKFLRSYRSHQPNIGIIFVVALSRGKPIGNLLKHIVNKSDDTVLATSFTKPSEMPWVQCYREDEIAKEAAVHVEDVRQLKSASISDTFETLLELRSKGDIRPIVFCGSLYLCSDILRYTREAN